MISEKKVSNAQMFIENNSTIDLLANIQEKNERTIIGVVEACKTVSELHIPKDAFFDTKIWKLTAGVHDTKTEMAKVQFELNLKIAELESKAQPLTPPEVRK